MNSLKYSTTKFVSLLLGSTLLLSGCSQDLARDPEPADQNQAQSLQVTESWAKAAQEGMSAAFATLHNASDAPIELVSVTDHAHGTEMQIHEMSGTGSSMVMQELGEPLVIDSQAEVNLSPGGHHIMYMDLVQPLIPAEVSTLTLNFSDGSSKEVDFAIRNYDGANESYHGDAHQDPAHSGGEH